MSFEVGQEVWLHQTHYKSYRRTKVIRVTKGGRVRVAYDDSLGFNSYGQGVGSTRDNYKLYHIEDPDAVKAAKVWEQKVAFCEAQRTLTYANFAYLKPDTLAAVRAAAELVDRDTEEHN